MDKKSPPKPRALTQKQILAERRKRKDVKYVTIYNRSSKYPVQIQLKAPKGMSWFHGQQTTWLPRNQQAKYPAHRLMVDQLINHEKAGRVSILSGREHLGLPSR